MPRSSCSATSAPLVEPDRRLRDVVAPRPRVAEPERGEDVDRRRLGPGVADRDADEDVLGRGLRVVGGDLPVAAVVEDARVDELELGVAEAARGVLGDEPLVGELGLRVHVAPAHPRVRRRRVEVPPVLLGVLAVVPLGAGEAEDALLQDRVAAVPEREREAERLAVVADAGEAVLAPAVGARAGVVVREEAPRVAAGAVVLAHRAPGALAEVRAPSAATARGRAGPPSAGRAQPPRSSSSWMRSW